MSKHMDNDACICEKLEQALLSAEHVQLCNA